MNTLWELSAPSAVFIIGSPGGRVAFGGMGLPPGRSINPATGVITGRIPAQSHMASPYITTVTAKANGFTRSRTMRWYVFSAIDILMPTASMSSLEGTPTSLDPITDLSPRKRFAAQKGQALENTASTS